VTAEPGPEPAVPQLRASDAERSAVVARLQAALAEGRITADEFAERSTTAYGARTLAELEPLTQDLPGAGGVAAAAPAAGPVPAEGRPDTAPPVVAIFGGAVRRGRWVPARRETAVAVFGGVDLDYREAPLGPGTLELRAFAVFGGVQVTVPEGVHVEMTGFALFGGRDVRGGPPAGPGAPVLRVHAVAVFGGVEARVRPRGHRP
jgi:Domain of unknown function (DUF1707)